MVGEPSQYHVAPCCLPSRALPFSALLISPTDFATKLSDELAVIFRGMRHLTILLATRNRSYRDPKSHSLEEMRSAIELRLSVLGQ